MSYELLAKKLSFYATIHLGVNSLDRIYLENLLLGEFNCSAPSNETINMKEIEELTVPDSLLEELYKLRGPKEDNALYGTKIMGLLTPLPSVVNEKFWDYRNKGLNDYSLNYLYNLSIKNNYIQKTAIDKNIKWKYEPFNNFIEITINLSKPEKSNKDIAKALIVKNENKYPKCLLCIENLGFYGNSNHPARENIRIIPMRLNDERFFMQYSPYAYYDHHVIIINENHIPMHISKETFKRHADFVDLIPEYFIGSNADLPIVGGSILSHEHYQGGGHLMPLMYAHDRFVVETNNKNITISYLDWFNSCICVKSKNKDDLIDALDKIRLNWEHYDDVECNIISSTKGVRHNTITPIMRKDDDLYIGYIILRNNRCNEEHPEGIFHAYREYHNIKSEGIGLIEAMGLFILPGRLNRQCNEMEEILEKNIDFDEYVKNHPDMEIHRNMIKTIRNKYSSNYKKAIKDYINDTCMNILMNTAVFKDTDLGNEHALLFIKGLDL